MTTLRQQLGDRRDWDELDRVEAMEQKPVDLNQLFRQWLEDKNATITVVALAPRGGQVLIENFLLDGWQAAVIITKKNQSTEQGPQR